MSGGPTFTVPVLDTQEFYDGIMKPITGQMYDLYLQGDYPRDLLLNLFVSKIIMSLATDDCVPQQPQGETGNRRPPSECEFVFHNAVGDEIELELFQALGDYLISLGLSTEPLPPMKTYFDEKNNSSKISGLEVKFTGASLGGSSSDLTSSGGESQTKSYGICFSPPSDDLAEYVSHRYWCKSVRLMEGGGVSPTGAAKVSKASKINSTATEIDAEATAERAQEIKPTGSATGRIKVSRKFIQKLIGIARNPTINQSSSNLYADFYKFSEQEVYLTISLRSVEAMIYYLGEVGRRQLAPEFGQFPRTVYFKTVPRYGNYPADRDCAASDDVCSPMFVLKRDSIPSPNEFLSVVYGPNRYSIPAGTGDRWSSAVFEIVKQQLALNSSAKSLPASNVISVVGQ